VERRDVPWVYRLSREGMVDWAASRSYVITLPEPERRTVLARVRGLLDSHPALAGAAEIAVPMVTRCSRADLPA
jgi:hypothetical protein